MTATTRRLATAAALVLTVTSLLAACSQPQEQEPRPTTVELNVNQLEGTSPILGAAFLMVDIDEVPISRASVIEVEPGVFVSPLAGLNADGTITAVLPEDGAVPASTLTSPDAFLANLDLGESCSIEASSSAAKVSELYFMLTFNFPGFFAVSLGGLTPAMVTTELFTVPEDFGEIYGYTFVSWMFADRAVSISTEPAVCVVEDAEFGIDLNLQQGWNQIAWSFTQDPVSLAVTGVFLDDSDHETLYLTPGGI